jgi:choline kinase|tara:strand:+ start:1293 stop:1955 length:663 start_codon:yes stop_codon:yes gene_type:complete
MRVIILAAGQGYQLDGFNKLLIRDPLDNHRIFDKYIAAFSGMDITVVVGYRAINVMQQYPDYNYIYNQDWAVTNNSYSLSLALSEEPCYVISGDLFIQPELIRFLEESEPDLVLTQNRENRTMSALNVRMDDDQIINEVYQGKLLNPLDPEAIGIFKITSSELLKEWNRNCRKYRNLFVGQNLPYHIQKPIKAIDIGNHRICEINTPMDYIRLLGRENDK